MIKCGCVRHPETQRVFNEEIRKSQNKNAYIKSYNRRD